MAENLDLRTAAYSILLQKIDQPLAIIDGEGKIVFANPSFDRLFWSEGAGRQGLDVREIASKGSEGSLKAIFEAADRDGESEGEIDAVQADGTPFHVQARAQRLEEGGANGYLLSVSQLSEPGSEYLTEQLFQHAVESANDAIIITTPELDGEHPMMLYVNPAFTRMTGYSFEEARGQTPRILQGPKTSRALLNRLRRDITSSGYFFGETINYRKDGSEYAVEWRISPLRGPNGETTHWVAVQRDVTDRVRQQDQIRVLNESLERRVKERTDELEATNRELETFNYSVSHDLRAPLRTILGFGSALNEDYGDVIGLDGRDYIERMSKAARRMDELITAILSLSRLARAKMNRAIVDLSTIAQTVGKEHERQFPTVRFRVEEGITANADEGLARAVLSNLLENAFKFSHRGTDPEVTVTTEVRNERSYLKVEDNGIGFDPKYTERIFESFERLHTDADFPGTGIGLATVLRAVRRHGGEVIAEGRPGEGATFLVWFGEPETDEAESP